MTDRATQHSPTAVAAVLAGGAGRRMGGTKAVVELGGRPLISYPLRAVEAAGLEPIVVCKRESELPPLDCRVLREPAEPRHPLAGIVAALGASGGAPVVAVGCDMPFLEPALLTALAALDAPLAVAEAGGRLQPLPGRYHPALRGELSAALDGGLSLRETVTSLGARILAESELAHFGDPRWLWFSVNDEAGLAAAEAALRARRAATP
ncbi:MAG TPA: NTP transferase domain-containing protein [Candidatus Limnocylindria bacterium]|nr:NTP transferase domain-containing protein [Candidatus Limnocylindria bacterium]